MKSLLIINAGSSSLKFAVFALPLTQDAPSIYRGQIDGIGANTQFVAKDVDGKVLLDTIIKSPEGTPLEEQQQLALDALLNWIEAQNIQLAAVGHRVLHGGEDYVAPVAITPEVLAKLETFIPLGPLHQPHNLRPIRALAKKYPSLPQVACFDTAFHRTQPWEAVTYPIPRKFTKEGVIRWGFHGSSYDYISRQLEGVLGKEKAHGAVVVAHMGNGASMSALRDLKCVATTMGFTAAEGMMMGTRCGTIDPAIVLYLMERHGYSAADVSRFLYKESGLLGVSGISQDMRTLESSDAPEAKEALKLFCYRAAREIGSLAMAAGGLDAVVFTGGIGENSQFVRNAVVDYLAWMGAKLDPELNKVRGKAHCVHTADSKVALAVIPTNEEWMIAHHTTTLLSLK
ncbi:acetate/propionate family kinase [Uliginosibacterium gangwonense]|uniref:acetate/propionate family kinase n=1 Tax=Uliginosibacterium gangwonense TaxID=392736 RepID=UPI000363304C|nr:acetate/propionate family kinase [Uliginosibacterium gangwonense]